MVYRPWSRSWWLLECKFSARHRYVSVWDLVSLLGTHLPTSGRLCFRPFLTSVPKAAKLFVFRSAELIIKNISVKGMVILSFFPLVMVFLLYFFFCCSVLCFLHRRMLWWLTPCCLSKGSGSLLVFGLCLAVEVGKRKPTSQYSDSLGKNQQLEKSFMKGSMFFVLSKMSCSVSRQDHLLEVNNKDKTQNVCYLGTPLCFVKHSSYFGESFWHVLLWQWLTSSAGRGR